MDASPAQAFDLAHLNRAFLDDPRKRVLLTGQAHLTKDDDTEVNADVIDYYMREGLVKARGKVQVRDRTSTVTGDTLDYNIKSERVVVTAPTLAR